MRVTIVDDLVLATPEVDRWLARWETEYAPSARERGLELVGVWTASTRDPRRSAVVVQWQVPSVGVFWAARQAAAADPRVAAFWRETDAVAVERDRRVLVPAPVGPS